MLLVLIASFCLLIPGLRFAGNGIRKDYISADTTLAVRGFFVLLVFFRHYKTYVELPRLSDDIFLQFDNGMGQLIVSLFLFYSGYGIYESYRKKGESYVRSFPKKRFLTVLLHFDIVVLLYLAMNVILGRQYSAGRYLLALTGWYSVGNSSWFIFVTLLLYIFTYIALRLLPRGWLQPAAVTLLTLVYAVVYNDLYPEYWWWCDTIYCYAAGMWYSLLREKIERAAANKVVWWPVMLLLMFAGFELYFQREDLVTYQILAVVYALACVWLSMKVSLKSKLFGWLGKRTFSLYMLQHLVMIVFAEFGLAARPYRFLAATFVSTLIAAWALERLLRLFDEKVLKIK